MQKIQKVKKKIKRNIGLLATSVTYFPTTSFQRNSNYQTSLVPSKEFAAFKNCYVNIDIFHTNTTLYMFF